MQHIKLFSALALAAMCIITAGCAQTAGTDNASANVSTTTATTTTTTNDAVNATTPAATTSATPLIGAPPATTTTAVPAPGVVNQVPASSIAGGSDVAPVNPSADKTAAPKVKVSDPKTNPGAANDLGLMLQVNGVLGAEPDFKGQAVAVSVNDGVLSLNGTVTDAARGEKFVRLLKNVKGVKGVKNNLRVGTPRAAPTQP